MNKKNNYISTLMVVALLSMLLFSRNAFGEVEGEGHTADLKRGKRIYSISCVLCHGSKGKGDGPASVFIGPYSHPRPNDFTQGVFKYRSTESGDLPTLSDLMRTIGYGIPGYMPSFRHLGEEGVKQVALYISDTFIEDELSLVEMDALKDGEESLMTVASTPTRPEAKSNRAEASRIEVYKEITAALNHIAKNSLTAMEQEENPQPTLSMYNNIVTTLNGIVSNLETQDSPSSAGGTSLQHVNDQSAIARYANQDNAAISLEKRRGGSRPLMSVHVVTPEISETGDSRLKSGGAEVPLPTFSDLFMGEESLIWD